MEGLATQQARRGSGALSIRNVSKLSLIHI